MERYFNPLLYSKLSTAGGFNDIVTGNNDTSGNVGGYAVCKGWGGPSGPAFLKSFGGRFEK